MSERTASAILFLISFLIFAEGLSWETASWPGPCLVHEPNHHLTSHETNQEKCATFLAGMLILTERAADLIRRDDNDKVIVAVFTVVLAISTICLWLATLALQRSTNRLWLAGERQIDVARDAANAALRHANAIVAIESPIPVIVEMKLVEYTGISGPNVADPVPPGMPPPFCRALIHVLNSGRTNMRIVRFCIEWNVLHILPQVPTYSNVQDINFLIPSNAAPWLRVDPLGDIALNDQQRAVMHSGQGFLRVFGFFTYENFMRERTDVGFLGHWDMTQGFVREINHNYEYQR